MAKAGSKVHAEEASCAEAELRSRSGEQCSEGCG